ncbi:Lrp/AsnC ligand binding domain-containing protein [Dehalococcoidia bacterium]|nr:Lrp/AsnC ligand binding domain-containing protein [Dehalococcoidia bacterium]
MTRAFVLIETSVGKTKEVAESIRGVKEVVSVDPVTGPYDIIVTIESTDLSGIGDIVTSRIHTTPGVVRTVTCLAV